MQLSTSSPAKLFQGPDRRPLIMLLALLGLGFLIAGSGRDDILSLMIWRPLTALALAFALLWGWRNAWSSARYVAMFVIAMVLLIVVHLIPLPPAIWTLLPGRGVIENVYTEAGMSLPWLPVSMTQARTWNALFSLAAPISVLLLALCVQSSSQTALARFVLLIGLLSGLIGLLQAIGPSNGPLYFYRITNSSEAVGLFANRNHQAMILACLFPLLAANLTLQKGSPESLQFQRILTVATGMFLIPLLLVTGSRSGVLLGAIGLAAAFWIYQPPVVVGRSGAMKGTDKSKKIIGLAGAMLFITILTVVASRAKSIQRLFGSDPSADLRFEALPYIWKASWTYFPFGSGVGSFVEVYKIVEPYHLLSPSYLNHAHSEPLELLLTGGLPAIALMIVAVFMWAIATWRLHRKGRNSSQRRPTEDVLGRTGTAICFLLALASIADYPLRVPSLAMLFAVGVAWLSIASRRKSAPEISAS